MYTSLLTYPVYDSNSSEFLELIRSILKAEFDKQISTYSKDFLPTEVKTDEYLLAPIADKEINPAFCSIIKAKMDGTDRRFSDQQNDNNSYIIGVLADGLLNLRKILDSIYIILNDMSIKAYIFKYKNANQETLISNSGEFYVKGLSTEFEVSKTMNDKQIIYGYLVLNAEIAEVPKLNTYTAIEGVDVNLKVGADQKDIEITTNLN